MKWHRVVWLAALLILVALVVYKQADSGDDSDKPFDYGTSYPTGPFSDEDPDMGPPGAVDAALYRDGSISGTVGEKPFEIPEPTVVCRVSDEVTSLDVSANGVAPKVSVAIQGTELQAVSIWLPDTSLLSWYAEDADQAMTWERSGQRFTVRGNAEDMGSGAPRPVDLTIECR